MEATRTVGQGPELCQCGGRKSRKSARCMRCEYARRGPAKTRPCPDCGKRCRGERCRDCWKAESNQETRRIPRRDARTSCSVDGCEGQHAARGYCEKHYTRWKRHGDPLTVLRPKGMARPVCDECGGFKKHHTAKWCRECWKAFARNETPCAVEGCGAPHATKGYCRKHAHRVARHGDPRIARRRSIEIVATLPKPEGECILWPYVGPTGYGRANYTGKRYQAHRLVWEQQVGKILHGLELDHLCSNRACVNVNHLEPVTGKENKRRRWARWWAQQEAV